MKRTLTGLIALLAAAAVLFAVLRLQKAREEAPLQSAFVFDTTRFPEIRSLRVAYHQDSMALIRIGIPGSGNARWVTADDSFPVDTVALHKALGWLLRTQTREQVTDSADASSLWDYGLNPEDARRVEWTWSDGSKARLLFGKTSSLDYNYTYWMWAEPTSGATGHAVYRTPGYTVWDISPRFAAWKQKAFWPAFAASDIRSLTVDWKDGSGTPIHYELRHELAHEPPSRQGQDGAYTVGTAPADSAAAARLFEKATQFAADDFAVDLDPNHARISLADPVMRLRIVLRDGTEHVLNAGPVYMGLQYTQHPSHRNLVWVFKWRWDYFRKTPDAFLPAP